MHDDFHWILEEEETIYLAELLNKLGLGKISHMVDYEDVTGFRLDVSKRQNDLNMQILQCAFRIERAGDNSHYRVLERYSINYFRLLFERLSRDK